LLAGPRGVGKTVLLKRIASEAKARGFITVVAEPYEDKSLPAILIPPLYAALIKLDKVSAVGELAKQAL
jgi:predicted AAA+ superfamily ATPase